MFDASRVMRVTVVLAVALVAGCDTLNWEQYRISGVHSGSQDAERVKGIVVRVAGQYGLKDETQASQVPGTVVLLREPGVERFQVNVGVRLYNEDAIVDLFAGFGPRVRNFVRVDDALKPALFAEFGTRCVVLKPTARVPVVRGGSVVN